MHFNSERFRKVIWIFSFAMLGVWIAYGWDSGIEQIFNSEMYGKSLHFSTMVTYGLLFYYTSKHIETWEISGFKNIFYSGCLTALNVGLFEGVYLILLHQIQLNGILQAISQDWFFLLQYVFITWAAGFGAVALIWETRGKTSLKKAHKIRIGSFIHYRAANNKTSFLLALGLISGFLFWIFYPLPTETLTYGSWTSSKLFPQTHYAYVNPSLYSANFLLHGVNIAVKALFALLQLQILRLWRRK